MNTTAGQPVPSPIRSLQVTSRPVTAASSPQRLIRRRPLEEQVDPLPLADQAAGRIILITRPCLSKWMITLALSVKPCPQAGQKGNMLQCQFLKQSGLISPGNYMGLFAFIFFFFLELYRPTSAISNYMKMPVEHLPNRNPTVQKSFTTTCLVKIGIYMLCSQERSDPALGNMVPTCCHSPLKLRSFGPVLSFQLPHSAIQATNLK